MKGEVFGYLYKSLIGYLMPRLKKVVPLQRLSTIATWITDTNPNSDYFKIAQFPDNLTGGKNGFLITGTENLIRTTEVLVEIVDSAGNTVYLNPVINYSEGLARVVSIEVYSDTATGPATITILGEVAFDLQGNRPPKAFVGTYNVKWSRTVNVDPSLPNTTPIRLYNTPTLAVSEQLIPYRSVITGSLTNTSTGSLTGQYVPAYVNVVGTNQQRQIIAAGTLISSTLTIFTANSVNGTIATLVGGIPFTGSINTVYSNTTAKITEILTGSDGNPTAQWVSSQYSMSFQQASVFATSSLNRSYANIQLGDLRTFTGDVYRAKFYSKGMDEGDKYQLLEDIVLEESELTVSQSVTGETISLGQLTNQQFLTTNWISGVVSSGTAYLITGSVTPIYDDATLLGAAYLSGSGVPSQNSTLPVIWAGISQSFVVADNTEYTVGMDLVCRTIDNTSDARLDVVLDGGSYSQGVGNSLGTVIASFTAPANQSRKSFLGVLQNFLSGYDATVQLKFLVYGGQWFIANAKIVSAREDGFNPDAIRVFTQIVDRRFETLQFKAELYDANNNLVPLDIETAPIYFDGGNVVVRGQDNRVDGILTIAPSGSGPTLSTKGFYSVSGSFVAGQSIFIGAQPPQVFNANTAFFAGTSSFGPEISVGDKLYGYFDTTLNEFVLKIAGTLLVGSGSNFVDIRTLLPRSPKDAVFARVTAQVGEFYDLRGDYAVTAGYVNDQIGRMGNYTRSRYPAIWQPSVAPTDIDYSFNAFATSSVVLATSCSITLPGAATGINNNTLYLNGSMKMTAYSASAFFDVNYDAQTLSSWTGYPTVPAIGAEFGGDTDIGVATTGSFLTAETINFPITVPSNRIGNTLYVVVQITANITAGTA